MRLGNISRVGRNKITQAKLRMSVSGKVGRVVPETPISHLRSNSLIPAYRAGMVRKTHPCMSVKLEFHFQLLNRKFLFILCAIRILCGDG
jgi:hypothetical protein